MIEIELPYPPSANHYYRHLGPRTLISREGRAYRRKVCSVLAHLGIECQEGPLQVCVDLYPPDRRRRDADNTTKAMFDALEHGGAYEDDSQIVDFRVRKLDPVHGGKAIIRIEKAHP